MMRCIHTCMHAHIYACSPTHANSPRTHADDTLSLTYMHKHAHTCTVQTRIHIQSKHHARGHTHTNTLSHTYMCACMHR